MTALRRPRPRLRRTESGQAGIEVVPFGLLTFVVATLLVANAWAVLDAKIAVSSAALEATRAYVEATSEVDPLGVADAAAREAVRGAGRDPERLVLTPLEATFARVGAVRGQLPASGRTSSLARRHRDLHRPGPPRRGSRSVPNRRPEIRQRLCVDTVGGRLGKRGAPSCRSPRPS